MAESKLRQLLHDLDVELQKTPGLDEKQRQHIATIRQEVEAVLAELGSPTESKPSQSPRIASERRWACSRPRIPTLP
jgi:hypothetical protein